ncbi:MAG: DNA integrity scanning protein DisA nucleotide-binding domain protein, partial [Deltaproteobacteria bacterium]|nr:DNA integrity scanning protein DisA nucleotide-binding domain protein [Deltaproteobacteria bacterium]
RAALGLTERCDASVVVVSEEKGEVSYAHQKKVTHAENPEKLTRLISESLRLITTEKVSWKARLRALFIDRWHVKLGTLALVIVFWLMLAGQQDFERTLRVPLEVVNLPNRMEILDPINPKILIRVRGLRKDASTLNELDVRAELDVSLAGLGRTVFTIARENIKLPTDRLHVVQIEPAQLKFDFKQNP